MTGQSFNFTLHLSPRARQYFYPDPLHISYTDSPSWDDLTEKVFSWFGIPGDDFALSYEDEDGDEVRISSEEELRIRCALISRACRSSRNADGKPVDMDFDVLDLRVERERRRAEKKPWVAPLSRLPLGTINNASAIPETGDHPPSRAPLSRLSIQYKLTVHRQGSRAVSMYSPTSPTIGRPMPHEGSDATALAKAVARSAPVSQFSFRPDTAVKPMQADGEVLPLRSWNPAPTPYARGHSRVHSQPLISVRPLAVVTPATAPPSSIRFSASIHPEPTSPPGALKRRSAIRLKGQRRISMRKDDEGLPSEAIELLRSIDELTTPGAAQGVRGFHTERRLVTA